PEGFWKQNINLDYLMILTGILMKKGLQPIFSSPNIALKRGKQQENLSCCLKNIIIPCQFQKTQGLRLLVRLQIIRTICLEHGPLREITNFQFLSWKVSKMWHLRQVLPMRKAQT